MVLKYTTESAVATLIFDNVKLDTLPGWDMKYGASPEVVAPSRETA
jgi:hypothetical protein